MSKREKETIHVTHFFLILFLYYLLTNFANLISTVTISNKHTFCGRHYSSLEIVSRHHTSMHSPEQPQRPSGAIATTVHTYPRCRSPSHTHLNNTY